MNTPSVPEVLRGAAALIRRGWSVGAIARNAKGYKCDFWNVQACSWCAYGAVARAVYDTGVKPDDVDARGDVEAEALDALRKYIGRGTIVSWSDEIAGSAEAIAEAMESCASQLEA